MTSTIPRLRTPIRRLVLLLLVLGLDFQSVLALPGETDSTVTLEWA